ncbi:hypothetical protein PG990_010880 [Apiospora arundinis]
MYAKSAFAVLSGVATLALGGVVVRPDDPYASLAVSATSYVDLVERIIAFEATKGESPDPIPSPVVSLAQQEAIEVLGNETISAHNAALVTRQSHAICNLGNTCFAPDAAKCVNYLAGRGSQECRTGVSATQMCHALSAQILGLSAAGERANSCANVARAAGHVLDVCTKPNNQINGQGVLDSDREFNVIIAGF